jgi:CRP/FNR family transcriptional regulator, cyclic AMP receptor protein
MTTQPELRILTALRSMKALQGVKPTHVKKLATLATEVRFAKDQIIYREGDLGDTIYFIKDGQVVIEMSVPDVDNPVMMYPVGPGELFGWSALFPTRRKQARARAVIPTQVIAVKVARLRELFLADQGLENAIIRCMTEAIADRMTITRQKLASMVKSGVKV